MAFTLKNSSVAEFFVELSNQLSINHRVLVFTHAVEENSLNLSENVRVLKWPSPRPTHIADMIFLGKMIRKYRPQVMISNFAAVNLFLILGFFFRVPQRIAWYHTLYSQLEKNKILKFRKRLIYKLATHLIANSAASKNDLIRNFGVRDSKITVVHNALERKALKNTGSPKKLVFAGRLDAVKGVSTLVSAMSIVVQRFPNLILHIIGDDKSGGEAEKLKGKVRDFQLEENIIFRGNKARNQVLEEFSTAWFSVVPSRVEAFGYVVIESFSVGTPVLGSDTSGIAEIIRDKIDGLLFRVEDPNDLADKMMALLQEPNLRNTMSYNCKKRFEEKFELSVSVKHFCKMVSKF